MLNKWSIIGSLIYLSIYLSTYLSICLSINLDVKNMIQVFMNAYYYFRCDERLYISIFMLRFTLHQLTDLQVLTNIYYLIFVKGIHISDCQWESCWQLTQNIFKNSKKLNLHSSKLYHKSCHTSAIIQFLGRQFLGTITFSWKTHSCFLSFHRVLARLPYILYILYTYTLRFTLHQPTGSKVLTNLCYWIIVKGIHISRLPMGIFFIGDLRPKYQLLIKKILFHHKIKWH